MRCRPKITGLTTFIVFVLLVLGLWALAACGGESTETIAAPESTAPAATTETTTGASIGTSGTITVSGLVDNPGTVSVASLEAMNPETLTIEHPKKGPVEYTGVRFSAVLTALGVQEGATTVVLTASDGFSAEVPLTDIAASPDSLLVIDEGTIASAFPGLEGNTWVKDIISMEFK